MSRYAYSTADTLPSPLNVVHYQYEDPTWGDLLTNYNGMNITYDEIGNPLTYRNGINFTWANGRSLYSFDNSSYTVTYQYDIDGLRTKKTVYNKSTQEYTLYEYFYQNGLLLSQKVTEDYGTAGEQTSEYWFIYDESGNVIGFTKDDVAYYYIRNLQGDVESITDNNGNVIVNYLYDTWGKLVTVSDYSGCNIGTLNSIRYRGYYYDVETGFYYLQSRYYDATVGRFINADDADILKETYGDLLGKNLFAYCGNNPINNIDPSGNAYFSKTVKGWKAWERVAHYFGVSAFNLINMKASLALMIVGFPTVAASIAALTNFMINWVGLVFNIYNAVSALVYTIKYNGFKYSGVSTWFGISLEVVSRY